LKRGIKKIKKIVVLYKISFLLMVILPKTVFPAAELEPGNTVFEVKSFF